MTGDDTQQDGPSPMRRLKRRPKGNPPEDHEKAAFFGRRAGKTLRPFHLSLMDSLLPQVEVGFVNGLIVPDQLFSQPKKSLVLEIGFGGGEHLAAEAVRNPETGYIGCEPFRNGIAKLLATIGEADLQNIRIHANDAGQVIDALPDACIDQVNLLYPDPWPKRPQRKRRFLSDAMLVRLARIMRQGAQFRFATDIDDYAGWGLARVLRSQYFRWPAENASQWLQPWPHWPGTRYEAKALREGRRPIYLTFVRR